MIDPISGIISLGLPLVQAGISAIGRGKARREQDRAYNELMSQNFGATASARNYAKNAVSGKAMQDAFAQMNKTMASGLSALSKGGARTAMQAGNVAEAGMSTQAQLGLQMQDIQNQANQFVAAQDFQGQQMRRNLEAQNVAGLAQREMQSQMGLQQGLQGLGRNALQIALGGGIDWGGGKEKTLPPENSIAQQALGFIPAIGGVLGAAQAGVQSAANVIDSGQGDAKNTSGLENFSVTPQQAIGLIPAFGNIINQGFETTSPETTNENTSLIDQQNAGENANYFGQNLDPMNILFPVGGVFDNSTAQQDLGFTPAIGGVLGMGFPFGNMMNDGFSLNQGQQQTAPQQREQEKENTVMEFYNFSQEEWNNLTDIQKYTVMDYFFTARTNNYNESIVEIMESGEIAGEKTIVNSKSTQEDVDNARKEFIDKKMESIFNKGGANLESYPEKRSAIENIILDGGLDYNKEAYIIGEKGKEIAYYTDSGKPVTYNEVYWMVQDFSYSDAILYFNDILFWYKYQDLK